MPLDVDLLNIIERRARRYYSADTPEKGRVILADSRLEDTFASIRGKRFSWVVTSPPYYGMKTYIPDQWLRNWFVGGPSSVQYESPKQLIHTGPDAFSGDLKRVWINVASVCAKNANMVIRFGGISDRRADPLEVIKMSLDGSGWRISSIKDAGIATEGKRQADSFLLRKSKPVVEVDVWAERVD
ncbi:hypothetical protein [Azotobacter chroococcum]|uniref:hypothetical protein n=1 Tax=Azotobacter chroococcum TaxID=353 RepID=UPI001EF0F9D6|nr:hypothetical protein [Azotobacter chroococcum]